MALYCSLSSCFRDLPKKKRGNHDAILAILRKTKGFTLQDLEENKATLRALLLLHKSGRIDVSDFPIVLKPGKVLIDEIIDNIIFFVPETFWFSVKKIDGDVL